MCNEVCKNAKGAVRLDERVGVLLQVADVLAEHDPKVSWIAERELDVGDEHRLPARRWRLL